MTYITELQGTNPSAIIELFTLELVSSIHGSSTVHRFHAGRNQNNASIVFGLQSYTALPIEADGFEQNGKQSARPTLRISNLAGTVTTILSTLSMGLEGAIVKRDRTLLRYLDNSNFTGGTSPYSPNPTAIFNSQVYVIDRKSSENRDLVEFELVNKIDAMVRLPKRQVLSNEFPGIGSFYR